MASSDTNLNIIVALKDQASAEFKKVGDEIEKTSFRMQSSFKGLSTDVSGFAKSLLGVGVAAGGAAIAFGVVSVKAYEDAQVAIARVDATLKSMGKAAVENRENILSAADAAVKLGFDDEDAAESITRFYQATGNLTQATKLNNIAMDLARAKHLDLSTAAGLVNQVLSGNGRVLKQYQINLKDSATPLEALGELQTKVAGQAAAFSGTFQGQMQVLEVSFGNIKEAIGGALVNALQPFIEEFTTWLTNPKTQENFKKWTADFQSWAEVIIPVVIDVFKLWGNILEGIFDTIIKIGDGMGALITKAQSLGTTLGSAFSNAGSNIKWAITGAVPGRASGGPVSSGSPYLVGENGPEYFVPSQSGTIMPHGTSPGGGTAITLNFSGSFFGTDSQTAEKFGNMIAKTLGQQLKLKTL